VNTIHKRKAIEFEYNGKINKYNIDNYHSIIQIMINDIIDYFSLRHNQIRFPKKGGKMEIKRDIA
jgi:hypothetical protein